MQARFSNTVKNTIKNAYLMALSHLPSIVVDEVIETKVKNGVKLRLNGHTLYFIKNKNNQPLAIYQRKDDGYYYCLRGLWS